VQPRYHRWVEVVASNLDGSERLVVLVLVPWLHPKYLWLDRQWLSNIESVYLSELSKENSAPP